jgi:hypothetical protein
MSTKAVSIVARILSRHPPDDQISRLRLPLWTTTGKAEPIAVMLRYTYAGDIGASRPVYSDLISNRTGGHNTKVHALADSGQSGDLIATQIVLFTPGSNRPDVLRSS